MSESHAEATPRPVHPLILSGGSGSRLWPLSRNDRPKQFLSLGGDRPMIVETVARLRGPGFADPTIVCNVEHRFLAAEAMREAGFGVRRTILEPVGRNTAAAIAVGALSIAETDPTGLAFAAASDHLIEDVAAFRAAIAAARPAVEAGRLGVFGVSPSHPETGYGYIEAGEAAGFGDGLFDVARFVEKPDAETAAAYVASGRYSWNAGLFFFRVDAMLEELSRTAPDVLAAARAALAGAREDLDFLHLDADAFGASPSVPFDVAVMERTALGVVAPVDMGWSDIGSWSALWEVSEQDENGCALVGDAIAQDSRNCLVWSRDDRLTTLVGVEDLIVAATEDAVLVAHRSQAEMVKPLVARLDAEGRSEHLTSPTVRRPWGSYTIIDGGPGFLVKRIEVLPRRRLSLQYHHHRAEHWVVVDGVATVTCGPNADELETFDLEANKSTYIPIGAVHRLENRYERPLAIIEVQTGRLLEESDIVRIQDLYGRS